MLALAIVLGIVIVIAMMRFETLLEREDTNRIVGWGAAAIVVAIVVLLVRKFIAIPVFWASLLNILPMLMIIISALCFVWSYFNDQRRERVRRDDSSRHRRGNPSRGYTSNDAPWDGYVEEEDDDGAVDAPWN